MKLLLDSDVDIHIFDGCDVFNDWGMQSRLDFRPKPLIRERLLPSSLVGVERGDVSKVSDDDDDDDEEETL